jgi:hypothetical protein
MRTSAILATATSMRQSTAAVATAVAAVAVVSPVAAAAVSHYMLLG